MAMSIPAFTVGAPLQCEQLTIFPLFAPDEPGVEYRLGIESLEMSTASVEEVSEGGSVPELLVKNRSSHRILFLEGEHLHGAKQNRVLNASVLVPADTELRIPVSCVEQGRWSYKSDSFAPAPHTAPAKLRQTLKSSVLCSLMSKQGHRSDQSQVWKEVERQQVSFRVSSETGALSDTFDVQQERINDMVDRLGYIHGAKGLAIAVGTRVVSIELFDKLSTCEKVWKRLIAGVALDALEHQGTLGAPDGSEVGRVLQESQEGAWVKVDAVGEGEEFRCADTRSLGSALYCDNTLIHFSLLTCDSA